MRPVPWLSAIWAVVCVQANSCKTGQERFGNSCYQLLKEMLTWDEAFQACSAVGAGGLVVPDSPDENQFIREMIKKNLPSDGKVWIGCTDMDEEGKWMQAGEAGKECKFVAWGRNEPNEWGSGGEDCAQMWNKGWVDIGCTIRATVICERHIYPDMICLQADADGRFMSP